MADVNVTVNEEAPEVPTPDLDTSKDPENEPKAPDDVKVPGDLTPAEE